MKRKFLSGALLTVLFFSSTSAFAYGSSGSSSSCKAPKFSRLLPVKSSEVAPGSAFSFVVKDVRSSSLKAVVKGIEVDLVKTDKGYGQFEVKGNLPSSLQDEHAKITVTAKSASGCPGKEGWLIKIVSSSDTTTPSN